MLALNGGKPEQLTLRGFLTAFLDFREEVVARRTAFELNKARDRAHVLCGLAVAVSNVDEVVRTIRQSADAAEAREKLMQRRWPAEEILPFIKLIDDPSHKANEDGTYNLSETQARAILDLRLQTPDAAGREGSHRRAGRAGREDQGLPRHPRLPRQDPCNHLGRTGRGAREIRRPAPHRDHRLVRRHGGRGPHRARGTWSSRSRKAATSSARRWSISAPRSAAARVFRVAR